MKNVCIVGYGAIGPIHAAAINKTEGARLYAVCETDADKRQRCVDAYSVVAYSNFYEMLADEKIDSIHICTPHHLHFEMAKKALLAGKIVVCEKPITMTESEFSSLIEIDVERRLCAVFQNRCNPSIEELKAIVDSGRLGNIKTAKATVTWCRDASYYAKDEWRGKWDTEGGGVLINQSIHTLDYFSYLCGDIKSVRAQMINFAIPEIEVEDTMSACLQLDCGARGIFFAPNAYGDNPAPTFEIVFEKGIARYEQGKLFVNGEVVAEDSKPKTGKMYWGRGHEMLIRKFYDFGEYFTLDDVAMTMNTVFAMYKSAENGGVEVNI